MKLRELVEKELNVDKWNIMNHKGEEIAMTYRKELLQLCREKRVFQKHVDKIILNENDAGYMKIKLCK